MSLLSPARVGKQTMLRRRRSLSVAAGVAIVGLMLAQIGAANAAQSYISIYASDAAAYAGLSRAVDASSDGSTVVATTTRRDGASGVGAVYAYLNIPIGNLLDKSETSIMQPSANDYETSRTLFGASVSLSADGRTVAVGAPGYAEVYIFTRTGSATTWTKTGKLYMPPNSYDDFGATVALSGDGTRLLVGSPGTIGVGPSAKGAASYYTLSSSGMWVFQATILGATQPTLGAHFGTQVALSADGLSAAISSPDATQPRVDLYTVTATALTSKAAFLDPSSVSPSDYGRAGLDLDSTSTTIAIGAPKVTSSAGISGTLAGVVYAYPTATPSSKFVLYQRGQGNEALGKAVSISPDGLKIVAGAPNGSTAFSYLWTRTSTSSSFVSAGPITSLGNTGMSASFGTNSRVVVGNPNGNAAGKPTKSGIADVVDLS